MPQMRRILIVDDDERVLFVLSHALSRLGDNYQILTSKNGRNAFTRMLNDEIDLMVADIMLPDFDGIELTKAVRSKDKDLPVIWITGHTDDLVNKAASELDVHHVAEKPVEVSTLREMVRSAIKETE